MKLFHTCRKHAVIASAITALAMLVITYLVSNISVAFTEDPEIIEKANALYTGLTGHEPEPVPDSMLFVNIAYDKQLIPVMDNDGFEMGNIDITDRHALYEFLNTLAEKTNYKYISLDVFFDKRFKSENDKMLFDLISKMPRIVIPHHANAELANHKALQKKSSMSDYTTTFFSKIFFKYPFIDNGDYSVALKMYTDITKNEISNFGPFYFDNGHLMTKNVFGYQDIMFEEAYDEEGNKNYYNLGADILLDPTMINTLVKGKYVIIGDFCLNDMHECVQGEISGPLITANSFISLMNGRHRVSLIYALLMCCLFFIFAYTIYSEKSLYCLISRHYPNCLPGKNSTFVKHFISFMGYTTILSAIALFSFYKMHIVYDIFITAIIIELLESLSEKFK